MTFTGKFTTGSHQPLESESPVPNTAISPAATQVAHWSTMRNIEISTYIYFYPILLVIFTTFLFWKI